MIATKRYPSDLVCFSLSVSEYPPPAPTLALRKINNRILKSTYFVWYCVCGITQLIKTNKIPMWKGLSLYGMLFILFSTWAAKLRHAIRGAALFDQKVLNLTSPKNNYEF